MALFTMDNNAFELFSPFCVGEAEVEMTSTVKKHNIYCN